LVLKEVEIVKNSVVAKALASGAFLMVLGALRPASVHTFAVSQNGYRKPESITFSKRWLLYPWEFLMRWCCR